MRLDQDARIALVGVAHLLACRDGLGDTLFQVGRVADPFAVPAMAAKIRKTIAFSRLQAVHRPRQHQRQRVLARSARPSKDRRWRKAPGPDALAQSLILAGPSGAGKY